jgi:hypothetical protein
MVWQHFLVCWTLDVMHCKMNIAKNFLKTITGKKNSVKVRQDLQQKGIRRHLWLAMNPRRGGKMLKPKAPYVLFDAEFETCQHTRDVEDAIRICFRFWEARTKQEVWSLQISQLSRADTAYPTSGFTGVAVSAGEDGCDADVQGIPKNMYKSVRSIRVCGNTDSNFFCFRPQMSTQNRKF